MNRVVLKIKGRNLNYFIHKLHKNKIDILKINYINKREMNIEVYDINLSTINNIKGIYEVETLDYKGIKKIKNMVNFHKYFIIAIFIGIAIFTILINIIYDIDISLSNTKLRDDLTYELKKYGIYKYSFKKSYDEIEDIKNKILLDMKDEVEWLNIERLGTKYIITLEPRKTNKEVKGNHICNIVSSMDALIKKEDISSGEVVKGTGEYVKKGEVIVSSEIKLFDEVKKVVDAKGDIYGEVWYKVNIEYPLNYYEEKVLSKTKTIYNFKIFDRYIGPKGFKNKKIYDYPILKNDIFPISLNKQVQYEVEVIDYKLGYKEALLKASEEARKSLTSKLTKEEYIIDEKYLKYEPKDSKIVVDIFYTVYKSIGESECD